MSAARAWSDEIEIDFGSVPDIDEMSADELKVHFEREVERWGDEIAETPGVPVADGDTLSALTVLGPIAVRGAARLRELAAMPIDWVWQDYVVGGTIVTVAGPSSSGKTTLMFLVMLARATTGAPIVWAGRAIKPAPPGKRIVLIEAEHGEISTARKLTKSAKLLGLGDEALDRIIFVARKQVILGSPAWKDVERLITSGHVSDIVLDTIARVAPGDGNSEQEQAKHFETIAKAIEKAPIGEQPTAWVLAHTRKGGTKGGLDAVSGSLQRVGQADTVLMVEAEQNDAGQVIASTVKLEKAREEPDAFPDPLVIRISSGKLDVTSQKAKKGDKEKKKLEATPGQLSKARRALELYLEVEGGHLVLGKLKRLAQDNDLGFKGEAWPPALDALVAEGKLVQREPKEDGTPNGWDFAC